jgi:hypothetical protein
MKPLKITGRTSFRIPKAFSMAAGRLAHSNSYSFLHSLFSGLKWFFKISETVILEKMVMFRMVSISTLHFLVFVWSVGQRVEGKFINKLDSCRVGSIQTLEWLSETNGGSSTKEEKSSVVDIFKELKLMNWECPVKIIGDTLKKSLVFSPQSINICVV